MWLYRRSTMRGLRRVTCARRCGMYATRATVARAVRHHYTHRAHHCCLSRLVVQRAADFVCSALSCFVGAFGATEAMTDRHCIATEGAEQPYLASSDPLSCCSECGQGCDGGTLPEVWQYWTDTGIVTGGPYGTNSTCFPYQFPSCSHHTDDPSHSCSAAQTVAESCPASCPNQLYTALTFSQDKHYGQSAYQLSSVRDIQLDILQHGPVEAAFVVYSDFPAYHSGVYHRTVYGEAALGGHAIVIKGWGVDEASGVEYWLCVNSWDVSWGERGTFKIRRGVNECGIEEMVYAGLPAVGDEAASKRGGHRK